MQRKYPHLSQPIKIGNVYFRNRMFSAPMGGTDITADCAIGPDSTAFYEYRAKGGAASVTVSELVVHPETEGSHMYHLDLATPGSLASFTLTADAIRRHGAIASVELSHSGQYAGTYLTDKNRKQGLKQWGPCAGTRPDGKEVHALSIEQIHDIARAFGEKAALAKRAGFEMVMIHGGHGWLINQFLSPYFNHRTDEYGGSLENRVRFAKEVLDCVRQAVGPGFPVEFRMSGAELFDGGYNLDEGIAIASALESRIDLLHVSAGTYQRGFGVTHPSMFLPHGSNVWLAEAIKKAVSIPVATVGGLNDPQMMEEIIASGKADVVEMARALLADPQLPKKVVMNQDDDIVRCLRCYTCMAERAQTGTRRCTVNPLIGRERNGMEIPPAPHARRVLVVGAGPAGLQAALTAARRGHQVTLCDKNDEVGGILIGEQAIGFKYEMYQLGVSLGKQCLAAGVDLRLNTRVDKPWADALAPEALIIAVGSEPALPPIPGLNSSHVIPVTDYHLRQHELQEHVVVLGGGLAGCEMAIHLAREKKNVTLVERDGALAPDANIRHRPLLLAEIEKSGIQVLLNHKAVAITPDAVLCEDAQQQRLALPGQSVICALGQRARRDMVDELWDCAPWVSQVGDCVKVSTITTAIYQGHHAAMDIC